MRGFFAHITDSKRRRMKINPVPCHKTATLSKLHHGVEDGEDVGEDGEDGGQPGDEGAVRFRFFVYV